MQVTEVNVLIPNPGPKIDERVLAFVGIVLDGGLAVHDIKLIDGPRGLIVAFPWREPTVRCGCGEKCLARHEFCGKCRAPLPREAQRRYDLIHPVTYEARKVIADAVIAAYHEKRAAALAVAS